MTTWDEYLDEINTNFDVDSPVYSSINVGTGMILNGNLRQSDGEIQANALKLDDVSLTTIQTGSESFVDNDTSLMTSAAIQDKIEAYGYSTTTGDITGVTAGSGLSGGGSSGGVSLAVADLAVSHFADATIQTSGESFADNDTSLMTSAAIDDRINAATPSISNLEVSHFAGSAIQTGSESFDDNDTTLMTSAAVQDKITSYGYITGVTNISGNAATATALQTARNIGGVSFDGTGNIDLAGVNTAGNQNTTGNAATATALATARAINGVDFDGTAAITVTADANTLSGTTLKSSVVNSSLTSVGTLSSLSTGDITLNGTAITATAAELNMLDGASTAWTSFTPVWEKGITDNGNASITANYLRFGDLCFYEMQMTMGSTTTFHATDLFRMQLVPSGLPTPTAGPTYSSFGGGWVRPTGSGIYSIVPVEVNSDLIFYAQIASGTYLQPTWVKKTLPLTWTSGGIIYINGYYRTA